MIALARSMRPRQWVKNGFVVAPVLFAQQLSNVPGTTALAFVVFCLLSSGVYLFNDVVDLEEDRQHPVKKRRPLAAGEISRTSVLAGSGVLLASAMVLGFLLDPAFGAIAAGYALLQGFYSWWLKRVVILDVMVIALGFVLRVEAGEIIVGERASPWIILSTFFISLFLGFTKRRNELMPVTLTTGSPPARTVLNDYSTTLLDHFILLTATGAILSYAVYTASDHAFEKFGSYGLVYTTVFVLYGVFRFYYLVYNRDPEGPTELLYSDLPLAVNLACWLAACLWIIGF